jgi:hypothetical protein
MQLVGQCVGSVKVGVGTGVVVGGITDVVSGDVHVSLADSEAVIVSVIDASSETVPVVVSVSVIVSDPVIENDVVMEPVTDSVAVGVTREVGEKSDVTVIVADKTDSVCDGESDREYDKEKEALTISLEDFVIEGDPDREGESVRVVVPVSETVKDSDEDVVTVKEDV